MLRITYLPVTDQQLRGDLLAIIGAGEYLDKPLTFTPLCEAVQRRCGPTDIERIRDLLYEMWDSEIITQVNKDGPLVWRVVRRTV